jgi:thiol-disulfide isomerase/thioredoxin
VVCRDLTPPGGRAGGLLRTCDASTHDRGAAGIVDGALQLRRTCSQSTVRTGLMSLLAAAVLGTMAGCGGTNGGGTAGVAPAGTPAPISTAGGTVPDRTAGSVQGAEVPVGGLLRDALLTGLNGPSRHLSAYRGIPLMINVWASWCGPCRAEMASLERLSWRSAPPRFAIIGISTDDDPAQAAALIKAINATLSQFIDRRLEMETMLGASRLPLTVLVDAEGRVLEKIYGAQQWDGPDALALIERDFGSADR